MHDVVVTGRVCIDLYPEQIGVGLEDVRTFSKSVGGSATNVAIASARLGHATALISKTGDDPFGVFAKREIERLGVDTRWIEPTPNMDSVLTFCEIYPPDDFPLYIWRKPTAPDMYLDVSDLPLREIAKAPIHWSTATGLSREPSRAAHYAAWKARGRKRQTILDLDYREMFWGSREEATSAIAPALQHVTVAVGNREECDVAVGETDPHRAADALLERGVELAIVKMGPNGVLGATRDERVIAPAIPVDVVNGLGAGDAFGGALCHGLLLGWSLDRILNYANAAGALVATRRECSTAMPTTGEIDEFITTALNTSNNTTVLGATS